MIKLLINEPPLQVLPTLAVKVGLNEAIFLQQLHYWLIRSDNEHEGRIWVFNSIREWNEHFPFWSISTIRRIIESLEERKIIITGEYGYEFDRRKWYTIDYAKLEKLCE